VREGLVFYYERENLKEGERIAAWVQQQSWFQLDFRLLTVIKSRMRWAKP
jgi:hypothetical protein